MKKQLLSVGILLCAFSAFAQPTDNPYTSRYSAAGHWTDSLKWAQTTLVTSLGAIPNDQVDDHAAIQQGIDQIFAQGGGVLYFPEGTYMVSDDLHIKSGVVLRGANPTGITSAKQTGYSPPSKLLFPKYIFDTLANNGRGTSNSTAFKGIEGEKSCSNAGLVNLDINRAYIGFHPRFNPNSPGSPQAIDKNRNLIIFGLRSNNAIIPDRGIPDTTLNPATNGPRHKRWQRLPWRFSANIDAYVEGNCVVANNRLNDGTPDSFDMPYYRIKKRGTETWIDLGSRTIGTGWKAQFNATDHYGISLNRSKIYVDSAGGFRIYGAVTYATPEVEPNLFSTGNEVRDNWVYKTSRVGITAAGIGLVIKGNETHDFADKSSTAWENFTGPTGTTTPQGATTFENRGIDFSGWQVKVDSNYIFATQNYTNGYLSTDGEGILLQECCGGTQVNDYLITNNDCNNYIGIYKMRDINNVVIKNNKMNGESIYMVANTNNGNYYLNNCLIEGNTGVAGITAIGTRGGTNGKIINNQGSGTANISCHVEMIGGNQGFTVQYKAVDPNLSTGGGGNVSGPCAASATIPLVTNITPSIDSVVTNSGGPYLITFKIIQGDIQTCLVDIYLGTTVVASNQVPSIIDSTVTYLWTPPATGNGVFAFTAKVKLNTTVNFSPVVKFLILNMNALISNLPAFKVYPNPASGILNIDLQTSAHINQQIQLIDGVGKTVLEVKGAIQKLWALDVSTISAGLYTLRYKDARGMKAVKVMVDK